MLLLVCFTWFLLPGATGTGMDRSEDIRPGNILAYKIDGKEVVFTCENDFQVKLSILGSDVIKVWMDPKGEFMRSNPSFAVVNEAFEGIEEVNIQETPQAMKYIQGR
ncbi:hypothetical protein JCM15548_11892 [Geofilum rubicundum JCM 15548]|uniref:Uncharacterized protein n=1 Tax=Geofilum rubicundum JCM 15548 TaxID=1236989 RepID=A0A0E9LX22_9BACT|nr:hypothetical protein JCM15548_11892 [Geofilum rubicundum JCM 15548]